MNIKSKLPNAGTTIFSVMTNLAIEHNAINLSQGFPGIASIPPSVFYRGRGDHRVLRLCFAKKDETLKEAADKLCRI